MINVKNEIQYILVTRALTDMAQVGLLTMEELSIAKRSEEHTSELQSPA